MINIHNKTLQDLEFNTVLEQVSELCITPLGHAKVLEILPFKIKDDLVLSLQYVNEYLSSFYNDNRIPNHGFDDINKELKFIRIENTFLEEKILSFLHTLYMGLCMSQPKLNYHEKRGNKIGMKFIYKI